MLMTLSGFVVAMFAAQLPSDSVLAFLHVSVIPMDREHVLGDQTVLVRGEQIVVVGPAMDVKVPPDARRIDGRGKFLMPGLGDMHVHLQFTETNVERQLLVAAANGVTLVRNMNYVVNSYWRCLVCNPDEAEMLRLRSRLAAGELWGPRIVTSGPWSTDSSRSVEQNVLAYHAAGYDFLKVHDENSMMVDSIVPVARRLRLPVAGHVAYPAGLGQALANGYASIEHLTGYPGGHDVASPTALVATNDIMNALAETRRAGVWNSPTLRDIGTMPHNPLESAFGAREHRATYNLPKFVRDTMLSDEGRVELDGRRRIVKLLQENGAGLLLGTDAPLGVAPIGFAIHHELHGLVRAGLTPYQALATGTRNIADFLGTLGESGTVQAGKRADLVLLDANPLQDIRNSGRVVGTVVAGRWLSRTEAERRLAEIYRRLPTKPELPPPSSSD